MLGARHPLSVPLRIFHQQKNLKELLYSILPSPVNVINQVTILFFVFGSDDHEPVRPSRYYSIGYFSTQEMLEMVGTNSAEWDW